MRKENEGRMFARFLGRQPNAKEETPEEDTEVVGNNNMKVVEKTEENNNESNLVKTNKKGGEEPATEVGDIKINLVEETPRVKSLPSPAGWIHSFDKSAIWPETLDLPLGLQARFDQRSIPTVPLDEKMNAATKRRQSILEHRCERLSKHNNKVAHALLVRKDLALSAERNEAEKITQKIEQARERRENILGQKRSSANDSITPKSSISEGEYETYTMSPRSKMDSARRFRSLYLQEVSRRAGQEVEYARMVASEVSSAEEEASAIIQEMLDQRLQRAEVRRSIVLDNRRLAAGRHGNYVKSVYLTNRYMDRRSAQMIQHNLDAAAFRREVKLEEIKSNARQQNLSAQFRACCAYRVLDAKWLNYALKSSAAQTTAKMRRDMRMEELQKRLHEAELRRADVLATHRLITSSKAEFMEQYVIRMDNAAYRRELFLYERRMIIQERANIIRARKSSIHVIKRRAARKAITNKLQAAKMRRDAFLESRRSVCATRNWHAKVCGDRQVEIYQEEHDAGLARFEDKLQAAEQRRIEYQQPIFAQLVSLRVSRAKQVRLARHHIDCRIAERKRAFSKLRLSALNQMQLNKTFDRLSRVKRVQSNRQFMDTFYKQVISNTTTARQRGAELRRALYYDAVKASARETIERSAAARERLAFREEEARELHEIKLGIAEARREESINERISSALWFQGKVVMARKRIADETEAYRDYISDTIANADLRRSILLTRGLQNHADRAARYAKKQKEIRQEREATRVYQDIKAQKAAARREAALLRKVEVARNASTRVTVVRLEKRAEDVVDAAIRTAICKTMSKNAEERRQEHLEDIQSNAASQVSHAKGVARYQKELLHVRAQVTLEQSKLRMLQTSK